jgi:hypothetical protein
MPLYATGTHTIRRGVDVYGDVTIMALTLSDKRIRHEQQKARLAAREGALREQERKARVRRLTSAGELVEKAGLLALETNALYGALLSLERGATDGNTITQWAAAGKEKLELEVADTAKDREPLVIAFPEPVTRPTIQALRAVGFQWSKLFRRWEGLATIAEAEALAAVHQGQVRRVSRSEELPPASDVPNAAE